MYSILLYLHTSTHATSYIGLIQQDKRGYNHRLTLEGAISVGSVTKRSPLANRKGLYLMHCKLSKLSPTPIIKFIFLIQMVQCGRIYPTKPVSSNSLQFLQSLPSS